MLMVFAAVRPVVEALRIAGLPCALGGSGLLCSLGLVDQVHDIDLTTDAPWPRVEAALGTFAWRNAPTGDGPFATDCRVSIPIGESPIDLMIGFAIRTDAGVCRLPTIVSERWRGIPVGSPAVWAVAYRLMGRDAKADLLSGYLRERGARPTDLARLLAEPLPEAVRGEVSGWPPRTHGATRLPMVD